MTWNNVTFADELTIPYCSDFTYVDLRHQYFSWQECQGKFGKRMDPYVAWGPYGQFINTCSDWNLTLCDLSQATRMPDPKEGIMTGSHLMAWGDGGIADLRMASLSAPAAVQTHLWKIAVMLKPVMLFNGSFSGTTQSDSNYSFTLFQKYNVTACMPFPYVFLVGKVTFGQ